MATANETDSAAPDTNQVKVTNVGPVDEFRFHIPARGGLVVLTGDNGKGKSIVLEGLESAATHRGKPPVKDRTLGAEIAAFGVTMKVRAKATYSGDLCIETLEGKLSIADLVDPGMKDPAAADAKRIKALVSLAGIEADPTLFHDCLGSKEAFDVYVGPEVNGVDDVVAMAAHVKRKIELAARHEEGQATNAGNNATAQRGQAEGVNLECEHDAEKLQAALEQAIGHKSALETADESGANTQQRAEEAKAKLEQVKLGYGGPTVDSATALIAARDQEKTKAQTAVEEARTALLKAEATLTNAGTAYQAAVDGFNAATAHEESLVAWQATITRAARVSRPKPEELTKAADAVTLARQAVEAGTLIRTAQASLAKAEQFEALKTAHDGAAQMLRSAAEATDEVLSGLVAKTGCCLRVQAGRLVTDTPERGETYFAELSDGQRYAIAVDIAIDAVGPAGVLFLPQRAYGELDGKARRKLHNRLLERGVTMLTAAADLDETSDGKMRAEEYK